MLPLVGRLGLRLAAMLVLLGLYRAWHWMPLRLIVRDVAAAGLAWGGWPVRATSLAGEPVLVSQDTGELFAITANCTYADLVLVLAAFLWRFGRPAAENALRLLLSAAVVLAANVARVIASVALVDAGSPRVLAHDAPDALLHVAAIAGAVVLAVLADGASRPPAPMADSRGARAP
jgi:hypothetical protein